MSCFRHGIETGRQALLKTTLFRAISITAVTLLASTFSLRAYADCFDEIPATQAAIEQTYDTVLSVEQRSEITQLLINLCRSPSQRATVVEEDIGTTYGTRDIADSGSEPEADEEAEDDGKRRWLNFDLRRTDTPTKGHERLKKKR